MEALLSSETSVLTISTRRNIPEYGILLDFIICNSCQMIKATNPTILKERVPVSQTIYSLVI
jgi:hypothetical protein